MPSLAQMSRESKGKCGMRSRRQEFRRWGKFTLKNSPDGTSGSPIGAEAEQAGKGWPGYLEL